MKMISIALSAALLAATTVSGASATDCGCGGYVPPKVKSNAGVGNGAEGGVDERNDRDPGNSGANNQAGKNYDKPNSPRAGTSIP